MTATLHTYDNGPMTEGWDCAYCAAPFLPGGQHHEHPTRSGLAFCRAECAEDYLTRESRRRTSQPDQIGLAF